MKRQEIYIKHEPFNKVYKEIMSESEFDSASFSAAKSYHHNPEKLEVFDHYTKYVKWFNELYKHSQMIIKEMTNLYDKSKLLNSSWFSSKKKAKNVITKVYALEKSIKDFIDDVMEFQRCVLATGIRDNFGYSSTLTHQIRSIEYLKNSINLTCNTKITEISSSRITIIGLLISISALATSFISLYITTK